MRSQLFPAILFSLIIPNLIYAQPCGQHLGPSCVDTIPSVANVINTTTDIGPIVNECYWICPDARLTINGASSGNININMEEGSILNFSGNESTIWAKTGCTVTISDDCAPIIHVKMEPGAIVNYNVSSGCVVIDTCSDLSYDYSEAPAPGCFLTIDNNLPSTAFNIYPNPSDGKIIIQINDKSIIRNSTDVIIKDLSGRNVLNIPFILNGDKIYASINGLNSGIYFVFVGKSYEVVVIE
ncbi:MAG: T9SS type A sorting domain-containing protein [Chitinophagales bacterium]